MAGRTARAIGVGAAAVALAACGLGLPAAQAAPGGGCQLVRLPTPAGSSWGTVTDVEVVDGTTVYYGSYEERDAWGGTHSRAVVWRGLRAAPEQVGPGLDQDIAFSLTASGLVNGTSVDAATGRERPWVRDLRTGRLQWVDTGGAAWALARGMNDAGALAGTATRGTGEARADDAVAWDTPASAPRALAAGGRFAQAPGINNRGQRSGMVLQHHLQGDGRWLVADPTVWEQDGTRRTVARVGIDAFARFLTDSGRMAGVTWWGFDPRAGHFEAAYWRSATEPVGLGVLHEGGSSEAFGLDDAGSVVGRLERPAAGHPLATPWGTVEHSFLWQGQRDAVRVLPSLHGVARGQRDWRDWLSTHAAHAVHTGLDQVGAGTHAGTASDGSPLGAPTVFLNASRCGVLVPTTHTPGTAEDLAVAQARAQRRDR